MSRGDALASNRRNSIPCSLLGLPDKGRAIKGLVVCNSWDLEPLDLLNGLALGMTRNNLVLRGFKTFKLD